MANGSNAGVLPADLTAGYDAVVDGELANALLPEVPDYDEDLNETFTGLRGEGLNMEEWDESYDDEYEPETADLFSGSLDIMPPSSGRDVSVYSTGGCSGKLKSTRASWISGIATRGPHTGQRF